MHTTPGLNALRQRRAALLLESELNRQALRVEILRARISVDRARDGLLSGPQLWRWLAPIGGFLIARKLGGKSGTFAKGSALIAVGRALWSAWKDRRRPSSDPEAGRNHA